MLHLIHGIHPSQPGGTVRKLVPFLDKHNMKYIVHEYGAAYAVTARFLNGSRATKIGKSVKSIDIIIGHSNGCDIARRIADNQSVFGLILINPALDSDTEFSKNAKWVDVYYNSGDEAVPWAKWLFAHPWGDMGRVGYTGKDRRVTSINCCAPNEIILPCAKGHSATFEPSNIEPWSDFMLERIEDAYTSRYDTEA